MVAPLKKHAGHAAPLRQSNIDTDQIIPSREIKTVSKRGLAKGLFAGWRYLAADGYEENPDFILNQMKETPPTIIIGGPNFGCGSSREHAVWALQDYGVRCIVAPSFGEIFYNNCVRNGVLPVTLSETDIDRLLAGSNAAGNAIEIAIDLDRNLISNANDASNTLSFNIADNDRYMLLNGLDAIALTEMHRNDINSFINSDQKTRPWAYSYHTS